MSELQPCPFCGGEAIYQYGVDWFNIACQSCGYEFEHVIGGLGANLEQHEMLIRSWNTRPPEDALRARAEKAEADAERLAEALRHQCPYCEAGWPMHPTVKNFHFNEPADAVCMCEISASARAALAAHEGKA